MVETIGAQTNKYMPTHLVRIVENLTWVDTQSFESKNLIFKSNVNIAQIKDGNVVPAEKELNGDYGYNYQWSNDNKNLFFINKQGIPNIYTVSLDGSPPKPLTNFNSGAVLNFDLSRDGKRLFIVRGIINSDLILIKDNSKAT